MSGPEPILDLLVVPCPLIKILDQQADRRSGCHAVHDAGQDAYFVRLLALGRKPRRTGPAPVQIFLHVRLGQGQSRGTAIDDAAERGSVALTERRDREQPAY